MFRRSLISSAVLAGGVLAVSPRSSLAQQFPIDAGSGTDTVQVIFDWPDGFVAQYDVAYGASPSDTILVYDATQAAAAADPNLSLSWEDFGSFGEFLNVANYTGGHIGDGSTYDPVTAPNNYWTEWFNDGSGWEYGDGASFDSLSDNGEVGWVFGSDAEPAVPEPASIALIVLGGSALLMRRRRKVFPLVV